jgi:soluble lytic murein transglycosylase-like protein
MAIVDDIAAEAQRQGVNPALAIEVATAESGLNPNTPDSRTGAIGLFQLEPATAAEMGVNPRDVAQNISGGIGYLKKQLARFGDVAAALAAYNWGASNVANAIARFGAQWLQHIPSETSAYIAKISRGLAQYQPAVTPASVANGVQQVFQAAPTADLVPPWFKWVLLTAGALGVYWLATEVIEG